MNVNELLNQVKQELLELKQKYNNMDMEVTIVVKDEKNKIHDITLIK